MAPPISSFLIYKLRPFSFFWSNAILTMCPLWVAEADLRLSLLIPQWLKSEKEGDEANYFPSHVSLFIIREQNLLKNTYKVPFISYWLEVFIHLL